MSDQKIKVDLVRESDGVGSIRFSDGGKPFARLRLSASQLDDLIVGLGQLRARLQPEIPAQVHRGSVIRATRNPSWHAEREPLTDGLTLMFRHRGFGWLAFVLPPPAVEKITLLLTRWPASSKSVGVVRH